MLTFALVPLVAVPGATHYLLANGLLVTFLPLGRKPSATIHLHVDAGHLWDNKKWGVSNLSFLLSLAVNDKNSASEYSDVLNPDGWMIRSSVGVDRSALRVSVSSEQIKTVIDSMADIVSRRQVTQSHLDMAKTRFIRDIETGYSSRLAEQQQGFFTHLVSDNVSNDYEKLKGSVAKVNSADLTEYLNTTWVAKRMHLFVVGVFNEQAALKHIEEAFIPLPAGTTAPSINRVDMLSPLSASLYKQMIRGDLQGFETQLLLDKRKAIGKDDLQSLLSGLSQLPPMALTETSRLPEFTHRHSPRKSISPGREMVVDQLVNFIAVGLPQQTLPQYIKRATTILPNKM